MSTKLDITNYTKIKQLDGSNLVFKCTGLKKTLNKNFQDKKFVSYV